MNKPTPQQPLRWALRRIRRARPVAQVRELIAETRTLARPVQIIVTVEGLAAAALAVLVALAVAGQLSSLDLAHSAPPWRALVYCLPAGIAAYLAHRARPLAAARRWHGIAVRRLDERLGRDDEPEDDVVDQVDDVERGDGRSPEQSENNERS